MSEQGCRARLARRQIEPPGQFQTVMTLEDEFFTAHRRYLP